MKIILDAMGGDHAPEAPVLGAIRAAKDYGVQMADGPLAGLLARAVIVIAPDGKVCHAELVPEITTEPNYEAAIKAIKD